MNTNIQKLHTTKYDTKVSDSYLYLQKNESLNERDRFAGFIDKLISQDTDSRIYNLLWNTYSGAVRMLIENKYVYGPFWDAQRGLNKNWEKRLINR